jgi:16S rRNA U516 pseudouridylate synthase RsuA-like enzyme
VPARIILTGVAAGRVRVNGHVAHVGQVVDPARDKVTIDGSPVAAPERESVWLVLHKPGNQVLIQDIKDEIQKQEDNLDDMIGKRNPNKDGLRVTQERTD